jgi:hypothetical protein
VCRQRDTPIITFVNKMDREVRDPLDILDEIERELGMPCVPMTWPVGQGKTFGGIINLRTRAMTVFESGSERRPQDFETIPVTDTEELTKRFGFEIDTAFESMELATGASPTWDHAAFLAGKQTPVFFGSGVNNFGVMEVLDALVDLAPSRPGRAPARSSSTSSRSSRKCSPKTTPSAAWCSRCRPIWTPTTATALPLCAWPGQIHAGHEAQGHAHRQGAAPHQCGDLHEPAPRGGGRSLCRATSWALPPTAACSWATPSPMAASTCSTPACPSLRPKCS